MRPLRGGTAPLPESQRNFMGNERHERAVTIRVYPTITEITMHLTRTRRMGALAGTIVLATLLALPATLATVASAAEDRPLSARPVPMLRVAGTGEQTAAPDLAIVSFGVVREDRTARAALDKNNLAMAAVIEAMKKEGIEARDIQTSGLSISPLYDSRPASGRNPAEGPRIIGYSVANNLTLRVRDLGRLGTILDTAVTLGVNSGGDIRFANQDMTAILVDARKAAVRDAAARAATLAEVAGITLGQILEINETGTPPRPMPLAKARMMEAASAVPIEGGENSYSVTVEVVWEIAR